MGSARATTGKAPGKIATSDHFGFLRKCVGMGLLCLRAVVFSEVVWWSRRSCNAIPSTEIAPEIGNVGQLFTTWTTRKKPPNEFKEWVMNIVLVNTVWCDTNPEKHMFLAQLPFLI